MCDYSPHDCNNTAHWWVTSPDGRTRHVCSDHRDARVHDGWTVTEQRVKPL